MLTTIVPLYMLTFCRVVIGLTFGVSSVSKVLNIAQFKQAISNFHILPRWLSGVAAMLFLCSEFAIVALVFIGGPLLILGFSLALGLLLFFCLALASVLARGIRTTCNCFGASMKEVSTFDVWRNIGLMICALVGIAMLIGAKSAWGPLSLLEWVLIGLGSGVFVMIWLQLGEIVQLFRQD